MQRNYVGKKKRAQNRSRVAWHCAEPKQDALWHGTVKLGLAGTEAPGELLVDCVATSGRLTPARGEDDLGPSLLNNLLQALEAVTAEELRLGTCEDRVKDTIHVEKDHAS